MEDIKDIYSTLSKKVRALEDAVVAKNAQKTTLMQQISEDTERLKEITGKGYKESVEEYKNKKEALEKEEALLIEEMKGYIKDIDGEIEEVEEEDDEL